MYPLRKAVHLVELLSVLALCACPVTSQYDPESHRGTTGNICHVFKGRCWDYEVTRYLTDLPRVETNCGKLWKLFTKAFSYKSPCDVQLENYQPFLEAASQNLPENKVLFWSGVFSLAHKLGNDGQEYVTLEDTLVGYLANSITWCGQSSEPGMNYTRCPSWDDCPLEAAESFWAGASTAFARGARGQVLLMLDGSNPAKPAYRRDSFFGKYELPNLSQDVTSVYVIVSHVLDKPKLELCGSGSLQSLEADVIERGFFYTCVDDPLAVRHLLCSQNPQSRECQAILRHRQGELPTRDGPRVLNDAPDRFS
ncbi:ADP-ribosyl cyclase 1 [Plakobranchus ocellatus]|uniref:ADP-ribosyl cyclase 1 n=1 Tax=Plakobranchus ocellatus TaxID=259542 RepID=A0AAV3YNY6_9GAST|nr:ADP-ribosyl cyclase 1 [Plakobranchus ocellatus]